MTLAATILPYLVAIALLATALVLAAGLVSMASHTLVNERISNLLMRWRVVVQGVAVGLVALTFVMTGI
ncbi:MAG: HIG1 domain-containing protein [Proteobacteria bacterium]|nr:HIG1 domain-containing protein [Pseudomonadota bacterium]MDA1022519.1 HIG1 domain-containing protein [Pseudomonadota bacterium]